MKKIYLASDSKARKELLRISGLQFIVKPSRVDERTAPGNLSYEALVRHNARLKGEWVARRIKSGIVIAADTIVVQDGRIFGKPQDMAEARRMLKRLSRRPQWLYTGIAVIDKDADTCLLECEKTRVYMDPLSDAQITNYFRSVSPLDKAGGFDIQGRGAFFIRRIEGCFYNVVGLPLRTLYRMLSKVGVKLFGMLLVTYAAVSFLTGCSTEYNTVTGQQEAYYYSTDKEVQMGESIARQVEKQYKLVDDPLVAKRVDDIGQKIAQVCDRREIRYTFRAIQENEVNAFSLPGGFVYINSGLIDKAANDDELAAVLAHEVGHIVARHSIKKLQASQQYMLFRVLLAQAPQSGEVAVSADAAFTELLLGYSREDEFLADQLGARYAKLAGYDPRAMITFLKKLQEVDRRSPLKPQAYFRTHPYVPDRIRITKEAIGEQMNFKDYINIQDQPHGR